MTKQVKRKTVLKMLSFSKRLAEIFKIVGSLNIIQNSASIRNDQQIQVAIAWWK